MTDAVAGGRRLSAQAIDPWPATCTTPSPTHAAQPPGVAGTTRSPRIHAASSISGRPVSDDQNITCGALCRLRASLSARKYIAYQTDVPAESASPSNGFGPVAPVPFATAITALPTTDRAT